ncbi:beta-lactamase family protein [Colletotrichum kahawae]|uniref:Beta-lactamase family protein n=1 Tax=Colletotrichum kahawae TaxID=34407 RepID=A0AAD9Y5T5_COLKA|nr:beta-lactamase family protein [Colletotrichum kahawae]
MRYSTSVAVSATLILSMTGAILADTPTYQPCPLLRAYYPAPSIDKNSAEVKSFADQFTKLFDQLIQKGGSDDFGDITPNTTSFSVVLFSGSDESEDNPVFFEYHHTASEAPEESTLDSDTIFPLGTLSQLFTVYAWLVEAGTASTGLAVKWDEITIGALAGQMSGLARDSFACRLDVPYARNNFVEQFDTQSPLFLPDTTPVISNAAFQLLAFALETHKAGNRTSTFDQILDTAIFGPLNMTNSGLLAQNKTVFADALNTSAIGEPGALSVISTASDLARAGHSMLSSRLISKAATRRWLQPIADTSNLRNGVGRPWEIYHAGQYANSSILDVYTKTGLIGHYATYFGLAPDFNAGFAILAHDTEAVRGPDLNVYADIVSLAIVQLQRPKQDTLDPSMDLLDVDLRKEIADSAGIKLENLDFRLYPSNVMTETQHQFVAVFQDKSAPVDMGTPTCITWQDVGSLGSSADVRFVFDVANTGQASKVTFGGGFVALSRSG